MERKPIITQNPVNIKLVQEPLTIGNMLPDYRYEFQSGEVSEESAGMFSGFVEFLEVNQELVLSEPHLSREDYSKGFQKAVALVRLWIDSVYFEGN